MTATAGLLLALVCMAIVAAGFALALTAWRPRPGLPDRDFVVGAAAGLTVGALCLLLGALHWLAHVLT